jgi:hypothetical protein
LHRTISASPFQASSYSHVRVKDGRKVAAINGRLKARGRIDDRLFARSHDQGHKQESSSVQSIDRPGDMPRIVKNLVPSAS